MNWMNYISLGKPKVIQLLEEREIDYSTISGRGSYFKLCSLLFKADQQTQTKESNNEKSNRNQSHQSNNIQSRGNYQEQSKTPSGATYREWADYLNQSETSAITIQTGSDADIQERFRRVSEAIDQFDARGDWFNAGMLRCEATDLCTESRIRATEIEIEAIRAEGDRARAEGDRIEKESRERRARSEYIKGMSSTEYLAFRRTEKSDPDRARAQYCSAK